MSEHDGADLSTRTEFGFVLAETPVLFDETTAPFQFMRLLLDEANQGEENLAVLRDYHFVRELGKGGMGAVGLIEHERTKEALALKVMLPRTVVRWMRCQTAANRSAPLSLQR